MKKRKQSKPTESESESVDESRPQNFPTAITRIAVAQICQSVGFRRAQRSALETLTDIAARYLCSLAKSAAASAVSNGRTQSNLLDVVRSLEELHSPIGFRGNSNVCQSLYGSSTLADIIKFVNYSREIPFAKPLPRKEHPPVVPRLGSLRVVNQNQNQNQNHIPKWLPAIPVMRKKEEERNREERWGVMLERESELHENGKIIGEKRDLGLELELPRERKKVSFRLEKGNGIEKMEEMVKNGVCKGGKRIMCQL